MDSEKVKFSALIVQGFAALSLACIACLTGISFAWPSHTLPQFSSAQTPLSAPMSTLQGALLGSLPNVGALVATPLCGYALDKLGRKYTAMLFGLPFVIAWIMIAVSQSVPVILTAASVAGAGAAGQTGASVYIAEIAHESIRGGLSSVLVAAYFIGLLISYTTGGTMAYTSVVYANLAMSIVYILAVALLKESPVFLVKNGREKEAAASVAFYRRVDRKSAEVRAVIEDIKLQVNPGPEDKLLTSDSETQKEVLKDRPAQREKVSSSQFLKSSVSSQRALGVALALMVLNTLMGAIVLQVFGLELIPAASYATSSTASPAAASTASPSASSPASYSASSASAPAHTAALGPALLALDFLLSTLACGLLVDTLGRKFLMTWTSVASCALAAALGAQLLWAPHAAAVTAPFIYAFCFVNYLGAATVPFIFLAEAFLPEVRGLCNSITMASLWVSNFAVLVAWPPLASALGPGPLFLVFAGVCALTALYSHRCLPETTGLTAHHIQLLFLDK